MGGCNYEMRLVIAHVGGGQYVLAERCVHCRGYQRLFPGWSKRYLKAPETRSTP